MRCVLHLEASISGRFRLVGLVLAYFSFRTALPLFNAILHLSVIGDRIYGRSLATRGCFAISDPVPVSIHLAVGFTESTLD